MDGNQSPETTCPKCKQPMTPVKGEIYYFCSRCWSRLDYGEQMRPSRPHEKKGQGMASDEGGAKK
jgi:hypothetical protein